MAASNIRSYNKYTDNLAQKKKRRFFVQIFIIFIGILTLAGASVYVLFFSPLLEIRDISITGLKTIETEKIHEIIETSLQKTAFNIDSLKPQKNIFFFRSDLLENLILSEFPVIKSLTIEKDYFHNLSFKFSERESIGSWCFKDKDSEELSTICRYFDEDGVFWGKTIKSSGSLLLTIEDMRNALDNPDKADVVFWNGIKKSISELKNIGMGIIKVEIPADSFGNFIVSSSTGHKILLDVGSDISAQIKTVKVFLDNNNLNPKPLYIDASINGKVYYK